MITKFSPEMNAITVLFSKTKMSIMIKISVRTYYHF